MKKTFANIRTLAALLIASAALAACSNDGGIIDNAQPAQQQGPQVYTLTLQAGKADNAQTRALELDGTKLVAKWAAGDVLTVKKKSDYSDVTGTLTASNVSDDGKSCTFSGTITGSFTAGDKLYLYYHLMPGLSSYTDQTGTLASAAAHDVAFAEVTVQSVSGSEITISETSASFTTLTAALKMTLTDGTNALNATSLKISVGSTDIFTFSPTAETYSANGDGILYFTLPCQADVESMASLTSGALTSAEITFTATAGGETYTATKTGYTFATSKYYATTLTMAAAGPTIVTWSPVNCGSSTYTQDGVTLTPSNGDAVLANNFYDYGDNTFTTTLGKFTKIEIVCTYSDDIDGWTKETAGKYQPHPDTQPDKWRDLYKLTWTGDAESVTIQGKCVYGMQSITFTIQ